jgi:hypothetical protein
VSTNRGSIRKRDGNQTFCSTFAGSPANLFSLYRRAVSGDRPDRDRRREDVFRQHRRRRD